MTYAGRSCRADAVNRRDADRSGNDVLEVLQFAIQRIVGLDDLLAVFVKCLAFARQTKTFLAAFDEQRLEVRSSAVICWETADCVTPLICAALVKLSVSVKSQNIFKLSICMNQCSSNLLFSSNNRTKTFHPLI
ncbi:MAG: hypothetical protein WDM80_12020 [Limisphaerales bacterium]